MYSSNIKKYRKEYNLTLKDLSNLTGLSAGYLCHLEKGSRDNPSMKVIEKIANGLNVDISKLVG